MFSPVQPVQVVNFNANDLMLSNGATGATGDGRAASWTPTYMTGQTPNGSQAFEFDSTDRPPHG